jgi:hypothetical protein
MAVGKPTPMHPAGDGASMYRIHPIRTGTLTSPKDALTYKFDRETDEAAQKRCHFCISRDAHPRRLRNTSGMERLLPTDPPIVPDGGSLTARAGK